MDPNFKAFPFPNSFESKVIAAGSQGIVWEFRIPAEGRGFISDIALNIPNSDCKIRFQVDGENVEEGDITYQIGKINHPSHYDPPIVVQRNIRFIGINNGATDETFEILCRGNYYIARNMI